MENCLHIHVTRWRSAGNREPVMMWACSKCHKRFEPLEQTVQAAAQICEQQTNSEATAQFNAGVMVCVEAIKDWRV